VTHDIVVLGAGPSGSVVARRLAAAGARVALVGAPSRGGWEGLSARSRSLLAEEGIDAWASVLEGPCARSGVWAEGRPIEGLEWLVERRRLAAALRGGAVQAGADFRPDTVLHSERIAGQWRVHLRAGAPLTAGLVVDARGRRGPQRRGPLLLAVGQQFRRHRAAQPGTQIHATDFGWCWWAGHADSLWVQVVSRRHARRPSEWIAAAAAQIAPLARALEDAAAVGEAVARPAHARLGLGGCDASLWRAGDAAFALDPLSGQGVYEAVRGARLVATALQSILDGGDAALAHRFVSERHEDAWRRGVTVAAGFYRENAARAPFWSQTAVAYAALLPGAAAVTTGIERRAVLDAGRIVERDVVVTADRPRGVWHVDGVPLVLLKSYLEATGQATVESAAAALGSPQSAVASAINWLQQTGIVSRQAPPRMSSGG
jgi:2-polyprenyl-6-methoxyphenol hydroxylase-like FAD-dependent oxidoreductase